MRKSAIAPDAFVNAKVAGVEQNSSHSLVTFSNEDQLKAKLVVLANGANHALREELGFSLEILSERHCLAIGFDVEPSGRSSFDFDTMTYWPERASEDMSYLTIFRIG